MARITQVRLGLPLGRVDELPPLKGHFTSLGGYFQHGGSLTPIAVAARGGSTGSVRVGFGAC